MEESPVSALNASPTAPALMVDGITFDLSEFDETCGATTPATDIHRTALVFDRGTSPRPGGSAFNTNWQIQLEGSSALPCTPQDVFSGIRQLLQNETACSQVGVYVACNSMDGTGPLGTQGLAQMNGLAAGATELPRLPESLAPPGLFSAAAHQPQSADGEGQDGQGDAAAVAIALISQKLDSFLSIMMQRDAAAAEREAASQERLDNALGVMQTATAKMEGLIASMMQREAELDVRDYNRALDLRLACGSGPVEAKFNWMFGHGVTPRTHGKATKSQARFERLQVSLRKFVLWFTDNASAADLSKVFIQFNDAPRVSISGAEIKDFLLNHEDMSQALESALIRVLRRDESHREPNSQGTTHYVGKEWARKVVAGGSTSACEELFYLRPKIQYNLAACKKVVVSLDMKQEGWASLTIDFRRCITYLIHPNMSAASPVDVLHYHIDLMKILTQAAQEHMTKHGGAVIPMVEWEYEVALKTEHHMNGPESGFTTAFYSIPKDNQFMIVSPETIGLAKHTFLYSMVRMSYRSTKRKIPQGKRKKVLKRGRDGKFISSYDPEGSGSASASDAASSA